MLTDLDDAIEILCERGERVPAALILAQLAEIGGYGVDERARFLGDWLGRAADRELDWVASDLRQLRYELMCGLSRKGSSATNA